MGIKKRKFFTPVKQFRDNPQGFPIHYFRNTPTRKISEDLEKNMLRELKMKKALIENRIYPVKSYNYSYIKDILAQEYEQKVSFPTIIGRARKNHFYFLSPKRKAHEREVLTNYPGEMIQHDSSNHSFSPLYINSNLLLIQKRC